VTPTLQTKPIQSSHRQRLTRWLGVVIVLLITIFSFWLALNPEWTKWAGQWGYIGAFVISLIASATIVLPAPGIAVVIAMGAALDPILLGIAAGLGSACGEMSGYIAGVTGRGLIADKHQKQVEWIRKATEKYGALLLFLMAAFPFPLFDVAGIIAGTLKMNVISFFSAVALGKTIKYIIMILAGAGAIPFLQEFLGRFSFFQ